MDYRSVVERLFERHRSVQTAGFSSEAYKPGLEQMFDYAAALGNPQRNFRSIHVAGTNGKGSVCSMLATALAASGFRTGLYTSPHILDFRERIKIILPPGEAVMITEEAVCDFMEHYDRDGLSFFEVTTGMAFKWFADSGVDIAVIETGLGGRLDSTNIITPEISVITSIGLDHCALLGNTRAEIAAEKAGIFKPGVPALVWGRDPETQPVFERAAATVGCPLYYAEDFQIPDGIGPLDLQGPCQEVNLRTVCAALAVIGLPATAPEAIAQAGAITGFRGRWEVLRRNPLVICDIGHNPQALAASFSRLEALRIHNMPPAARRPLIVVYGAMADKDVDGIVTLMPEDAEYILVRPDTPRAMGTGELALKLKAYNISVQPTVADGVRATLERAEQLHDAIIYIGGSTYVVSEAISYLESV
ncbi:MAG: bifunctional folylpolyglutamate synthase/dihydrofolate synthase [Bacteroidales bacterium]|nr:bifunctional folylpolyglutamate synthase/dihydrofolate synthase [Bacteroidales bacterium]